MNKDKVTAIFEYFEKSKTDKCSGSDNMKLKCRSCGDWVSYSKKATSNLVTHLQVRTVTTTYLCKRRVIVHCTGAGISPPNYYIESS